MTLKKVQNGELLLWMPDAVGNAAFTSRPGGVSSGPFLSLNVGDRTGDRLDLVRENRRRVSDALGISDRWISVRQVHGSRVVEASEVARGDALPEADAIVSAQAGAPLAVVVADCLPIALTGPSFRGVIHAGWRGLCSGVIDAALSLLPADASRLVASIGPSIGPCHYEVGQDVVGAFRARYPSSPGFTGFGEGKVRFDLRAAARWVLRRKRVTVNEDDPPCTFCDRSFFSHRRDGITGRQAVIVW